jgi:hypothetical protein
LPVREPDPDEPTLVGLTKKALDDVGMLQTWQAAAAVALAELIDSGAHGASGAARNVVEHRSAMEYALASAGANADVLDIVDKIFLEN